MNVMLYARYDPKTDKIIGAKEGSLIWYHEDGHRQQHKSGLIEKMMALDILLLICMVFLAFQCFLPAQITIVIYSLGYGYLEVSAWMYAFDKYFKFWGAGYVALAICAMLVLMAAYVGRVFL